MNPVYGLMGLQVGLVVAIIAGFLLAGRKSDTQ